MLVKKPNASNFWRGICSIREPFLDCIIWRLDVGNETCFWKDKWVAGLDSLESYAVLSLNEAERNRSAAGFVCTEGRWKFNLFEHLLPNEVVMRIASMKPPFDGQNRDDVAWRHSLDGTFTNSSVYEAQFPSVILIQIMTPFGSSFGSGRARQKSSSSFGLLRMIGFLRGTLLLLDTLLIIQAVLSGVVPMRTFSIASRTVSSRKLFGQVWLIHV